MSVLRLDKFLVSQGFGSRKEVHSFIWKEKVSVNGDICKKIDFKVDPDADIIALNGEQINYKKHLYIMMNKPAGVISASNDPRTQTVIDILPDELKRKGLFPAGRLDKDTHGLLIITDDGEFSHRMLAPKSGVYKIYHAEIDGRITDDDIEAFKNGIVIDGGDICRPAGLRVLRDGECQLVEVSVCEGKYHQVKRMLLAVGRKTLDLKRVSIGGLKLDEALNEGECRELKTHEIDILMKK